MKVNITVLLSFFFVLQLSANNETYYQNLILDGNRHYENGQYDSAITAYSMVANANYSSPALFYNLGNSYFKTNQLAPAIYYYEKAKKLAPFDADVKFNLKMAYQQITDRITPLPPSLLKKTWLYIRSIMSVDTWAILTIVLFFLSILGITVYLVTMSSLIKKATFLLSGICFSITLLTFVLGYLAKKEIMSENQAIVFSPTLNVKAEPKNGSADLFIVHEGTKLKILEHTENWDRISLPDGNEGWVPGEEIKRF